MIYLRNLKVVGRVDVVGALCCPLSAHLAMASTAVLYT